MTADERWTALEGATWWTRTDFRGGYTHMIRATDDPERDERAAQRERGDGYGAAWKAVRKAPLAALEAQIFAYLLENGPATWNRTCVELWRITADMAHEAPDNALWNLVRAGDVQHTTVAPIFFAANVPERGPRRGQGELFS